MGIFDVVVGGFEVGQRVSLLSSFAVLSLGNWMFLAVAHYTEKALCVFQSTVMSERFSSRVTLTTSTIETTVGKNRFDNVLRLFMTANHSNRRTGTFRVI